MQYTPSLTIETDDTAKPIVQQDILELALEKTCATIKEGCLYKYLFIVDGSIELADSEENEDIAEDSSTSSSDDDCFYEGIRTPKKNLAAMENTYDYYNYIERQSHYTNKRILLFLSKNKQPAYSEKEIIAAVICTYYLEYRPYINIQELWLSALTTANHITRSAV